CPARFRERLETDLPSVPTIARGTARALCALSPLSEHVLRHALIFFNGARPTGEPVATSPGHALADHVGQQSEEARPLDRGRELALLLRRHRSDAARHDLAALRDVALQELHILVVDLRRVRARERTRLAAAEERTARATTLRHAHRSYSSVAVASVG